MFVFCHLFVVVFTLLTLDWLVLMWVDCVVCCLLSVVMWCWFTLCLRV